MVSTELEQEVVAAYRRGWKVTRIEKEFGLPGATIYTIIRRNGLQPNRVQRKVRHAIDGITASKWLARINEQEDAIDALEEEVRTLRTALAERDAKIAAFEKRLRVGRNRSKKSDSGKSE